MIRQLFKKFILQFSKFSLIGILGVIINYLSFIFFYIYLDLNYIISGALGYLIPAIPVFLLNKLWTFKSKISNKIGIPIYFVIDLIKITIHVFTQFTVTNFFKVPEIYSQGFGISVSIFVGFLLLKKLMNSKI